MKKMSKLLSLVLALVMVMSFAFVASAEENALTSADELVSGQYYVVCTNGVGLGVVDGTWITAAEDCIWTLNVTENGVTLCDSNGVFIAPKGGNANGLKGNEYEWAVSCEDGLFTFAGQGDDTVYLAYNGDAQYLKFRGYKTATCNRDPEMYPNQFYLYPVGGEDEVVPPAGPVDCEIPGTLEYTFETDDAAAAGVNFRWTATADGELSVARMAETYMSSVQINGTYGEIGNEGYIVKAGDVVDIIVYGYGAGTISVPVEFITGEGDDAAVGTAENPEEIAAGVEIVKSLESGEYYFSFTAAAAGEVTITTVGDGTHNMEVTVNGDKNTIYSNWDNDGEYVKLNVAAGDVLTLLVYFDYPGAGTITFTVDAPAGEIIPTPDPEQAIGNGDKVMIYFPAGETYITAAANDAGKKLLEGSADEAAVWTVEVDENGYYTFIVDGKYLTSGATGNQLTLEDAPSELSLWTLVEAENGWYIQSVNAAYNGNPQYLEYYSGFTTYGMSATSNVANYTFQFEVVENTTPAPNPGTGDVIFAVLSILTISGMGITAVASKKN